MLTSLHHCIYPTKLLHGVKNQYEPLIRAVGDSKIVMLGTQTQGSEEFFTHRSEITKHLILNKGFNVVALGCDWPDGGSVNKFVHGESKFEESFACFKRFPHWLWRNVEVADFSFWLREHNTNLKYTVQNKEERQPVSVFGLDLYSVHDSIQNVRDFLKKFDRHAVPKVHKRYSMIEELAGMDYALHVNPNTHRHHDNACKELARLAIEKTRLHRRKGIDVPEDRFFEMIENAKLVVDAEEFYRKFFSADPYEIWNLRERHMADTLGGILKNVKKINKEDSKVVVWLHNLHVCDGRFVQWKDALRDQQCVNFGEFIRGRFDKKDIFTIGMTTYGGTVLAAPDWGESPRVLGLDPADPNSVESILHNYSKEYNRPGFYFIIRSKNPDFEPMAVGERDVIKSVLNQMRPQRNVGVIYNKDADTHYVHSNLWKQYDALIHLDHTRASHPYDTESLSHVVQAFKREVPQSKPFEL